MRNLKILKKVKNPVLGSNLFILYLGHSQPTHQVSYKSFDSFLSDLINRQTNKQTRKQNSLGGVNNKQYHNNKQKLPHVP